MQASQDQDVFQADRALLNPTFEAYKLLTGGVTSKTYRLPSRVNHPEQPQGLHVSRKVLQDQAGLNHLVPSVSSSSHVCAYIDESGFVVLIDLGDETKPTFHPLRCLDVPDEGSYSQQTSLVALPDDQWLAAGAGARIELLQASKGQQGGRWSAAVLASWQPEDFGGRLLQARRSETDPSVILALVQSIRTTRAGDTNKVTGRSTHKTTFEVALLELRVPSEREGAEQPEAAAPESKLVEPTWTLCGDDPIYHCQLRPSADSQHLLVAESAFLEPAKHDAAAAPKPVTTQAPAGGTGTASGSSSAVKPDSTAPSSSSSRPTRPPRPPPLFTWHQTPDTVTLIFPLPPSINKSDVRVHFSPPSGLSVHLAPHADLSGEGAGEGRASKKAKIVELREGEDDEEGEGEGEEESPAVRTAHALQGGRYANRTLWAPIDASGCVWTWERVNTTKSSAQPAQQGLLTIFLEKKDEGTRWSAVFDEAERRRKNDEVDDDEDDPPETQDPSDLLSMVQNMDKYTVDVDVDEADDGENPLFNTQRDSLLHDGLEAEDADVGRPARVTAVSTSGEGQGGGVVVVSHPRDQRQASCLARPLPGSGQGEGDGPLVIRRDLDGLVFSPPRQEEQAWQHLTTLPALSFVLASKRDLRAVYVAPPSTLSARTAVLAFEDAPRVGGEAAADSMPKSAGNLFVYYTAAEEGGMGKKRNAPSRVIRLGDSGGEGTGSLMGAAALNLTPARGGGDGSGSKHSLVVLCEKALLVLRGVLDDEGEGVRAS